MVIDKVYAERFRNDGKSILPLNDLQKQEIRRFGERVATGYYVERQVELCPLCRHDVSYLVAEKDRYGLPVRTVICRKCGLVRTLNQLDALSTERFYSDQYRSLYEGAAPGSEPILRRFVATGSQKKSARRLVDSLSLDPARHAVVEVGTGGGWNLVPFLEMGFQCVGSDFDASYLEVGRAHGLELVQGGITELAAVVEGRKVGLALLSHVLEHVADPGQFLGQASRLLAGGGFLRVQQPGLRVLKWGYAQGDLLHTLQNAHSTLFDLWTLRAIAEANNLELLVGDETLDCILRKVDRVVRPDLPERRGDEVLRYLRSLERWRAYWALWQKVYASSRHPDRVRWRVLQVHYAMRYPRQYLARRILDRLSRQVSRRSGGA